MPHTSQNNESFTWLGVFGHPDDETSASAGTMVKWIEAGNEVYIVTATGGEEGTLGTGGQIIEREKLGSVREAELKKNLNLYGANPPFLLRYRDQDLDKEDPHILSLKVLDIMHLVEPDIVVTFGPSGISNHPDHIAIHKATLLAFEGYSENTQSREKPLLMFPSIPQDLALEFGLELSEEEKRLDIIIDITSSIDIKVKGLKNYQSQEDAQELAKRFSEHDHHTESFAIGELTTGNWEDSNLVRYLRNL